MFICPHCSNFEHEKLLNVSIHARNAHGISSREFYTSLFCENKEPTCKCGCGGEVTYLDITRGFREFIRGHAARVNNNFQTEKSVKKSKATRKRMHEEGQIKIWNAGLTGDIDERVALNGKLSGETIRSNPQELERRSKRLSKGRKNGTVPTLSGPDSPQWKGGISPLYAVCNSNKKLYKYWKFPILVSANFTCQICKASRNDSPRAVLEVHHNNETMSNIVKKTAKDHKWENTLALRLPVDDIQIYDLKQEIAEAVANYHIENNVSGLVLCVKCHKREHGSHNL